MQKNNKVSIFGNIKNIFGKLGESLKQSEYNKFLDVYYKREFADMKVMHIYDDISHERVNYFYLLPEDAKIIFKLKFTCSNTDEPESYKRILEIFKILEKHNRKYNIEIEVNNREMFRKSNILEHSSNINLTIFTDLHRYSKEKYLEEEKSLEELIFPIRNSNLSPYEKYLAAYNIVKQYNSYRENPEHLSEARSLRHILKGDYIVCVGFSKLLETLLDMLDIPCSTLSTIVKIDDDSLESDVFPSYAAHQRNIVKMDDDKYNIHGIYVVDSTWDNDIELDLYNHANMTFDRTKELENLEVLKKEDYLLDFHDFDEFCQKINFYLKRKIKRQRFKKSYLEKIISSYEDICREIMEMLYRLDYNKWKEFINKYKCLVKHGEYIDKEISLYFSKLESIYQNFLTEYAYYILPFINNKISEKHTFDAAMVVKREIDGYNNEELEDIMRETIEVNKLKNQENFPYIYDYYEKRNNYLKVRKKRIRNS